MLSRIPTEVGYYWALEIMADELGYQTYLHIILVDEDSLKEEKCLVRGRSEKLSLKTFAYFIGPIEIADFPIPEFFAMKVQLRKTRKYVVVDERGV